MPSIEWPKSVRQGCRRSADDTLFTKITFNIQTMCYNKSRPPFWSRMSLLFPEKPSPAIKSEQVRLLYRQGAAIQLLGILTAVIAVALFWEIADHKDLLGWLFVMVVVSLIRLGTNVRFSRFAETEFDIEKWEIIYLAGTFASGVIWGALSFFYEPTWPVPYQVMFFVIYTGLIGGAFNTNSSLFIAFPAFYLPPVASLMYVMLQQNTEGYIELALLFMIYIALMHTSSVRYYNHLTRTLELQFDNIRLADRLALSNKKLTRLAEIDTLTQTFNRRSMDRFLADEWKMHLESGRALSVLFIDIDNFKQYNDTYGHGAGDRCLSAVSEALKKSIRAEGDMLARYGGEEFAVILPHTECEKAQQIAGRIMEDVRDLHIEHAASSASDEVTVSIGISTIVPDPSLDAFAVIDAADKALYTAKRSGRNRIVCTPL